MSSGNEQPIPDLSAFTKRKRRSGAELKFYRLVKEKVIQRPNVDADLFEIEMQPRGRSYGLSDEQIHRVVQDCLRRY